MTAPHHPLAARIGPVVAAVFTLSVTFWSLFGGAGANPDLTASGSGGEESSVVAAKRYVLARPFDALGWLAWVGSSGQVSIRPLPTEAEAKVNIAVRLALARSGGDDGGAALAAMLPMISTAEFHDFIAQGLQQDDRIVTGLLMQACRSSVDLASLAAFAAQVVGVRSIPDEVVRCIGERAIEGNQVPFAYWLWLNGTARLPTRISHVINGDFESDAMTGIFDWRINPGGEYREGFSARIQKSDVRERGNVLAVRFNGRSLKGPIGQQVLALGEGEYALRYLSQPSTKANAVPLVWQVSCLRSNTVLTSGARHIEPLDANWSVATVNFIVPAQCTGQKLSLDVTGRLDAADGGRGSINFDDIGITRIGAR